MYMSHVLTTFLRGAIPNEGHPSKKAWELVQFGNDNDDDGAN